MEIGCQWGRQVKKRLGTTDVWDSWGNGQAAALRSKPIPAKPVTKR
jgi:hypothetical protein